MKENETTPEEQTPQTEDRINQLDGQINDLGGKLDRVVESTNAVVEAIREDFDAKMTLILNALQRPDQAKNHPVAPNTKGFDANVHEIAQPPGAARFDEEGGLVIPRLMDTESPEFKTKAETTAFMNEMVTIRLHPSNERRYTDPRFTVTVNGKTAYLRQGTTATVPRYIVERLALARPVHYECEEFVNEQGSQDYRYPAQRGLRYPFRVEQDSDKGHEWLRKLERSA